MIGFCLLQFYVVVAKQIFPNLLRIRAAGLLYFKNLGVDKRAVPPALQEMTEKSLFAIKETAAEEIAVNEVGKRAPK